MSRNLKYVTPLLAAATATVAIAAAPTAFRSRSPVLQREWLGNRLPVSRQRSVQGFPAARSVPPLRRPGLAALPPLSRCAGHRYHNLVAGIDLRRRGRGAVGGEARGNRPISLIPTAVSVA
jgi:hypothetical protein